MIEMIDRTPDNTCAYYTLSSPLKIVPVDPISDDSASTGLF
jgi:hypothetical protein